MPTLYGTLGAPFVRKAIGALTEKGIEYDHDSVIPFGPNPEYRKIHPLGRIPAYRDGDRVLPDSSVILAYLERTHPEPPLYPVDPYEYARALWYEEFGDEGLSPAPGGEVRPLFDSLEQEVAGKQFLVGSRFTVADIGVATQFVKFKLAGCSVDVKRWPQL